MNTARANAYKAVNFAMVTSYWSIGQLIVVGQMDSYIRMFDAQYKRDDDNPTIGLILCSEKNDAVVKYSVLADAKQIFASKFELA